MLTTILRWLALPLVVAAVAACGVLAALTVGGFTERWCVDMVGGACVEGWHVAVVDRAIRIALAVVLLLLPVAGGWVAPHGKRVVAIAVATLGAIVLWVFALRTGWAGSVGLAASGSAAAALGTLLALRRSPAEPSRMVIEEGVRA